MQLKKLILLQLNALNYFLKTFLVFILKTNNFNKFVKASKNTYC